MVGHQGQKIVHRSPFVCFADPVENKQIIVIQNNRRYIILKSQEERGRETS
jgi:hypothetical protein